ncbi:hypothetical protein SAMN03080615_00584 [Amphritea atlantica]|uniref:Uncharacterized protein n=1 Tax=Amphritea atlantica TaxID=355243 RepID=A0A1H9DLC2_9GAMM|nr:hypothetical protein [Amphritea atlantica]SEQ13553.1 hypothetical protein SAMN03080615_00584 [Amphritea atlantica]
MKSIVIILAGLWISWHYTDLHSDQTLFNMVAPLGVLIFGASLAVWLVLRMGSGGRGSRSDGYSGDSGGFFDGDSGGGDGGGD